MIGRCERIADDGAERWNARILTSGADALALTQGAPLAGLDREG